MVLTAALPVEQVAVHAPRLEPLSPAILAQLLPQPSQSLALQLAPLVTNHALPVLLVVLLINAKLALPAGLGLATVLPLQSLVEPALLVPLVVLLVRNLPLALPHLAQLAKLVST
jgi:hypothetical protein